MAELHQQQESYVYSDGERRTRTETIRASGGPSEAIGETHVDSRSVRYTQLNASTVNGLLAIVLVALESLLLLRFLLVALGASTLSGFVRFVLNVSHPFVRPFEQAFSNRTWDQGIVEPGTLLAMGVYLVAFGLAMMLIAAVMPQFAEQQRVARREVHRD